MPEPTGEQLTALRLRVLLIEYQRSVLARFVPNVEVVPDDRLLRILATFKVIPNVLPFDQWLALIGDLEQPAAIPGTGSLPPPTPPDTGTANTASSEIAPPQGQITEEQAARWNEVALAQLQLLGAISPLKKDAAGNVTARVLPILSQKGAVPVGATADPNG